MKSLILLMTIMLTTIKTSVSVQTNVDLTNCKLFAYYVAVESGASGSEYFEVWFQAYSICLSEIDPIQ